MSDGRTLFDHTSRIAGDVAARSIGSRYEKILRYIREHGPSTLFEIAADLGVFDHQISGRFTELAKDGLIEDSGERRTKPKTKCPAIVWRLRPPCERLERAADLADYQGYPVSLKVPGDGLYHRAPVLEREDAAANVPGVPYVLDTRAAGTGLRLTCRVELVMCGGCGRPVKKVVERGKGEGGRDKVTYRCGTLGCGRVWELQIVQEPGGPELLALVMRGF